MSVELLEETVTSAPILETPRAALKNPAKTARVTPLGRAAQGAERNWLTTSFMLLFHLGAVASLFFFSWSAVLVLAVTWLYAINMGIGMGYHRLLTHRGYRVPKWVEYVLAVGG